ncbi:MAG: sodium:proton antiporter NhaD [Bacteroidia bacterium]|nr:sodium:proton antiporter NhaD [Bacteroidia bacterium]
MFIMMLVAFVVGYICIALEHPLKIDKAASAVLTGVICWTLFVVGQDQIFKDNPDLIKHETKTEHVDSHASEGEHHEGDHGEEAHAVSHEATQHYIEESLLEHLGEIAEILFFLLGAMTIVELVDAHEGFRVVTDRIRTTNKVRLLWIISIVTFFFSAALDNLTTSIVMAALLPKLIKKREDLWFFAGMVVIAANAGGAWSPIGDVTTIMLWIGGQVTAFNIIVTDFLPSVVCLLVPLTISSFMLKGDVERPATDNESHMTPPIENWEQLLVFWMGVLGLLFVPVFKTATHLPPYMGVLMSLGVIWVTTEILHRRKVEVETRSSLLVSKVIARIDTPSVLFFLGILLAVASLQVAGHLGLLATSLDEAFQGNIYIINILIGLLSSIVDNVPMVAAAIGMYPIEQYAVDHPFWELLAYCAGTGGSALIIGSAAGVAIMGILKIDFMWYLRKITWLAVLGYFAGVGVYYIQELIMG